MKKDNHLMALLSVWGIMLVILGHSGFEEPIIRQKLCLLHSWIYSFHMPLFFMISGFLFSHTNKSFFDLDLWIFIRKKVQRLLVPYVTIGFFVFLIKYAFSSLSHANREFTIGNFFYMFIAPSAPNSTMGYLWYVITLFVLFVIVVVLSKMRVNMKLPWVSFSLMFGFFLVDTFMPKILLFNFSQVVHYMPIFFLGFLFKEYEGSVIKIVKKGGEFNVILSIAASITLTIINLPIPSAFVWFVRLFVGVWMSISICQYLLDKSKRISAWLLQWSHYTYSIYILSWFGQYAAKVVCVNILHLHWSIAVVSMFVCGVGLPLLIDSIVDKCKLLSQNKAVRLIIGY